MKETHFAFARVRPLFALVLCCLGYLPMLSAQQEEVLTPREVIQELEAPDAEAFRPRPIDTNQDIQTITFGSCNKLDKPQDMWDGINANRPDLWIWLGDIIYADTDDMREMAREYRQLKMDLGYKKLRARTQVIGVWDDHDYGVNDGGKGYPKKKDAMKNLCNFLDVPRNAPLRKQEGMYQSYTFGAEGKQIKVIILDTRYFRDTLYPDPSKQRRYLPNLEGDILGEDQWTWLENELRNSPAKLNILCSSIQVIPDEHPHEKWGNFPNARKRLLSLIAKSQARNVLLLTGDRHMAEVSKMDLVGLPYPLYEFTSSGLTHIRSGNSEANKFRVGDLILRRNFGMLRVEWINDAPLVRMQVRGLQNELYQETIVKYD